MCLNAISWHVFLVSLISAWALVFNENVNVLDDSDGAAALVLVSGEKALKLGLQVIAKISGYADAAQVLKTFKYELHLQVSVHIDIHIKSSVLYVGSITLCSFDVICTGPRVIYNSSSHCHPQSYCQCRVGAFKNWFLWN